MLESYSTKEDSRVVKAIPIHIQRIIELDGGNEYKEGRGRNPNRVH